MSGLVRLQLSGRMIADQNVISSPLALVLIPLELDEGIRFVKVFRLFLDGMEAHPPKKGNKMRWNVFDPCNLLRTIGFKGKRIRLADHLLTQRRPHRGDRHEVITVLIGEKTELVINYCPVKIEKVSPYIVWCKGITRQFRRHLTGVSIEKGFIF